MAKSKGYKSSARSRRKLKRKKIEYKKKEFQFHSLSLEQLQHLTIEEFLQYIPSRMRRSLKRGLTHGQTKLLKDIEASTKSDVVRTHLRDMVILPSFIGHRIAIHNGNEFQQVTVEPDMVGHFIGEFALTRKKVKHTGPGVGATRSSKFMPLK